MNHLLIFLPIACLLYVLVSCIFDAFEDLSGGRVRHLEETDPEFAARLDAWLEKEDRFRAVFKLLLFVITMVIGGGVLILADRTGLPPVWSGITAGCCAVLSICILSEIIARLILPHADLLLLKYFMPVISLMAAILLFPLRGLYRYLDKRTEELKSTAAPEEISTVEDEILDLMEEEEPSGPLEEGEKRMIKGIFELQEKSVREIMVPRVDMVALPITATTAEARKLIVDSGHSRIPVYGRSIDEIKGILYAKDFVNPENDSKPLSELAHEPVFIPETKAVDELLEEIQRCHNHCAVIIDEYGGTSGIITLEDIIEEIIGDVQDEFDNAEDAGEKPLRLPDGSIQLEARTPLSELGELLAVELPETEDADTIGGYICSELGRIPETGETFTAPGLFQAEILSSDQRRIKKIKIKEIQHESE